MTPENVESPPTHETATATLPAPEAFIEAMAQVGHQYAGAVPEDAPAEPVQARLPIPRPPFDAGAALHKVTAKRAEVRVLERANKAAAAAAKEAREELADANEQLGALIDAQERAEADARAAADGEQLDLHTGIECYSERTTGEVCPVCAEARAQRRTDEATIADVIAQDAAESDQSPVADLPPAEPGTCPECGHAPGDPNPFCATCSTPADEMPEVR